MSDNFDIKALSDLELYQLQERLETERAALKKDVREFEDELERRYGPKLKEGRARASKSHGTFTEMLLGGYQVKHEQKLNVSWDTDKLMAWANTVPWETVTHHCRIKFEVKEANYKALEPSSELRKVFADSRTEKSAKPTFELLAPSQK